MVHVVAVTMEGEGGSPGSDNDEIDNGDSSCVKSYRRVRPLLSAYFIIFFSTLSQLATDISNVITFLKPISFV